jgi:hypothetical protein
MPRRNRRPDNVGLGVETLPGLDVADTPVGLGLRGRHGGPERAGTSRPPRQAETLVDRPRWSAYHGRPTACQNGVRLAHDGNPAGHATHARYRRKYKGEEHLICQPCATVQHAADGFTTPLPSTMRRS